MFKKQMQILQIHFFLLCSADANFDNMQQQNGLPDAEYTIYNISALLLA